VQAENATEKNKRLSRLTNAVDALLGWLDREHEAGSSGLRHRVAVPESRRLPTCTTRFCLLAPRSAVSDEGWISRPEGRAMWLRRAAGRRGALECDGKLSGLDVGHQHDTDTTVAPSQLMGTLHCPCCKSDDVRR